MTDDLTPPHWDGDHHTDEAKALVERLRGAFDTDSVPEKNLAIRKAHDLIETQAREIERLRNAMVVMDNTVQELTEALHEMFEAVCGETGFAQAVRAESGIPYPWPALDLAEAMARAALAGDSHDQ